MIPDELSVATGKETSGQRARVPRETARGGSTSAAAVNPVAIPRVLSPVGQRLDHRIVEHLGPPLQSLGQRPAEGGLTILCTSGRDVADRASPVLRWLVRSSFRHGR